MKGPTHRAGGAVCASIAFLYLSTNNLLLPDVSVGLQYTVIYASSIIGARLPDIDQSKGANPFKDPAGQVANSLLRHAGAKHRSIYTHSLFVLLAMIATFIMRFGYVFKVIEKGLSVSANDVLMFLMFGGLILGIISHLILDMLTYDGIWLLSTYLLNKKLKINLPEKIRLLPKKYAISSNNKNKKGSKKEKHAINNNKNNKKSNKKEKYIEKTLSYTYLLISIVNIIWMMYM